ncbi:MAG: GDSL-type esterase/lipase family protein [Cyanobacteria bacterium P01_F01_bin.13]
MAATKTGLSFLIFTFVLLLILILLKGYNKVNTRSESMISPEQLTRIIFFGDSITREGVQPDGYITIIADSLKQQYPDRPIEVIGAGVDANKVTDLQGRLKRDVLAKHPTHVVIYIGINDVWHFYGADQLTGTNREVFEQGLRDLIAQIQNAGIEVSLCTPSVIGEDPDSDELVNQLLMDYANISRTIAKTSGTHLCDLRSAFEQYLRNHNLDQSYEGILTRDGVHLNDEGNRFVADFLLEHLSTLPFATQLNDE